MKTTTLIKAIIFTVFIFSGNYKAFAADNSEHCKYYYENLKDLNAFVCSNEKISTSDMQNLRKSIQKTYLLYPKFIKTYMGSYKVPTKRYTISIMTIQEINTPDLFNLTRDSKKVTLARYFPIHRLLYATKNAFKPNDLDIPHEIAHYLNETNGVVDVDKDEAIAYAFEKYYIAMP